MSTGGIMDQWLLRWWMKFCRSRRSTSWRPDNLLNSLYSGELHCVTQRPDKVGHCVHKESRSGENEDIFFILSNSTAPDRAVKLLCFFALLRSIMDPPPPAPLLDAHLTTWDGVLVSVLPYASLKTIATSIGMPRPWPKALIAMRPRIMTALSAIVPRPAVDPVTNLTPFLSPAIPIPPPLNGGGGVGVGIAGIGVGVGGAGNGVDGDGGNAGGAVNGAHGGDAGNGAHGDDAGNGGHDGRIGLGNALNNDNGVPDALAIARRELEEAAMIIRAHQDRIAALEREKQLAPPSILPHIPPATVIDIGQFIRDNDVFSTDPFTPHVSIYTQALRTFRSEATEFLRSGDRELTPTWLRSREGLFSRLTTLHDVGVDCLCLSPSQSSAWKTILNRSLFRLADGEFLPLRNELSAIISLFGWLVPNPNASLLAAAILQESRQWVMR
ncbi:hypothetical protein BC829DRAFT_424133 [Chytridium lagenaria]|nr:hypothetical protein BC829DRAFT_424133 [Chytridium lagenaria]